MNNDSLFERREVQAAFLTAALLPYSEEYALEHEVCGFIELACMLYDDILAEFEVADTL